MVCSHVLSLSITFIFLEKRSIHYKLFREKTKTTSQVMAAQVTSGSGLVFAKGRQWYTFISSRSDEVNCITSHLHFVESSSTGIHLPYKNQKI